MLGERDKDARGIIQAKGPTACFALANVEQSMLLKKLAVIHQRDVRRSPDCPG
jgi:hypothetical protein